MEDQAFECIVCFEICKDCINCSVCHQILCKSHVQELHQNQCPGCRNEPFAFQENVALQRIIDRYQEQKRQAPRWVLDAFGANAGGGAPTTTDCLRDDTALRFENEYGLKAPRDVPNEDEFMKLPTRAHKYAMQQHVQHCDYEGCHVVWSGPWGRFIGGKRGKIYFDLTDCATGRTLNEMIGWNYNDPLA